MTGTLPYTLLDHTADLGIMIRGNDLIDLFKNAGKALICLMLKSKAFKKSTSINISISGIDLEDLMVRWLGEILYLFEGENLVITDIDIHPISGLTLNATLKTTPFNPESHTILREIKAVTYHQIEVAQHNSQWVARVIFDL
jgi:SHS2 domain-containing protein